jgi:SPP1 gp7 family putative phage head morphogenesis protein
VGLKCCHADPRRDPVHKASLKAGWNRHQRIVDKLAPRVERLAMRWFRGVRDQVTDEAIRISVDTGDPAAIVGIFEGLPMPRPPLPGEAPPVSKGYTEAVALEEFVATALMKDIIEAAMAAGEDAWDSLPALGLKVTGSFTVDNPYVGPAAQERVGWLIQEVRNGTNLGLQEAVAGAVQGAYAEAMGVRGAAKTIRGMVGLRPDQVRAVNKLAEKFAAAGMRGDKLASRLARESAKRLTYRANMIAHTEMARAVSSGRYDSWRDARDRGLFGGESGYVEWVAGITDRTCDVCADLHGTIEPLDSEFQPISPDLSPSQQGVRGYYPPIHPLCRCDILLHIGKPTRENP